MNQANASSRESKTVFGLIIGVPLAVLLISTAFYFMAERNVVDLGTVNRGELINPPLELAALPLRGEDGSPVEPFRHAESTWLFLVSGGERCAGACERMLYLTRQSHVALGKKMPQVSRAYLGNPDGETRLLLRAEHADMQVFNTDADRWQALLAEAGYQPAGDPQFFVVDPNGWLMMRYSPESLSDEHIKALGKDVLKDMKRLLK